MSSKGNKNQSQRKNGTDKNVRRHVMLGHQDLRINFERRWRPKMLLPLPKLTFTVPKATHTPGLLQRQGMHSVTKALAL